MPTLGNHLDFAKLEARNVAVHNLTAPPSSPVAGQMYFDTSPGDLTLYWYDGSSWIPAKDIGGGGAPTGAAGGDLSGTYPNPTIGVGKVTSSHILDATITDTDVAAANKDGAAGTFSMRTLGTSATSALKGSARVTELGSPNMDLFMNGFKIWQLADPTNDQDATNKRYVDNLAQGLDAKASVRVVATGVVGAGNSAPGGSQTIDGVVVADGNRVLIAGQTSAQYNGIYTVVTGGSWSRVSDMNAWAEVPSAYVFVEEGTANADTGWLCTANAGGTLDTTAMPWVQFSAAGQITSGAGLTKTGNTLDVGAGAGITVNADTVQVANDGITNAMLANGAVNLASADVTGILTPDKGGTGMNSATANFARTKVLQANPAATTYTITAATHGLGAYAGMMIQVMDVATGKVELPDIAQAANGDITITWAVAPAANSKYVTIIA